jgi:hypothetical protein
MNTETPLPALGKIHRRVGLADEVSESVRPLEQKIPMLAPM